MKKFLIVFMMLVIFVTGCGNKKFTTYHEIGYVEYNEMIDNSETFPLVIGSSTCSACSLFKPIMENFISKYQVEVYYIDLSKLSEEDFNSLKAQVGFSSTPTTVFFEDGSQTSSYYRIVGSESLSSVVSAYKRMGYIGE